MTDEEIRTEFGTGDFFKGQRYLEEGRVRRLEILHLKRKIYLQGEVKGKFRNCYDVTVVLDERSTAYQCECPQYAHTGQCKHIVAVLLAYLEQKRGRNASQPPVARKSRLSDSAAARLLRQAEQTAQPVLFERQEEQPVTLLPQLGIVPGEGDESLPVLGLTVGRGRQYVVKSIDGFLDAMERQEEIRYGKELTFVHRPELLEERSRRLLELVRQNRAAFRSMLAQMAPVVSRSPAGRQMPLAPNLLDELFELYEGERLGWPGREASVTLSAQRPELRATLTRVPQGMELSLLQDVAILRGASRRYLMTEGVLFPCDPELETLARAACGGGRDALGRSSPIFFAEADLPTFAAGVLPMVKRCCTVDGDETDLERYVPALPSLQFFLDWDGAALTARLRARYGGQSLDVSDSREVEGLRRNRLAERRGQSLLERWFGPVKSGESCFRMEEEERIYAFSRQGIEELQGCGEVFTTERMEGITQEQPKVSVGVSVSGGLLDLQVDAGGFPMEELAKLAEAVRSHRRYYRMKNGSFLSLEEPGSLTVLAGMQEGLGLGNQALASRSVSLPLYRALYLDETLRGAESLRYSRDDGFRQLVRSFHTVADSDFVLPEEYRKILRPYQKTGFRWLKTLAQYGFGGILADDMGLGKTVQALAYLSSCKEEGSALPSLVVCPASLVLNWGDECKKFAPELKVQLLSGSAPERSAQWDRMQDCDLGVISYDSLRRDVGRLKEQEFDTCILDEAQYIKNRSTLAFQAVKRIRARHRFAMTGTPVENRLSELWSIFDFLMPGYLYRYGEFQSRIEKPAVKDQDEQALQRLGKLTRPFLLRRMKAEVLKELPPKTESVRYVSMGEEQKKLYTAVAMDGLNRLRAEGVTNREKMKVLVLLMRLRQICCDPRLCMEGYQGESAKLESCIELVREAVEGGHRILLFSQFTSMLELLRQRLEQEGIHSFVLQGSTSKGERARLVERFNRGEAEVFLISLKAGGTGLNLPGADTVIHYDPWWNEAAQNQATDRAYRIGQRRAVQVYKLIGKDTIEERILELQQRKRTLADSVAGTEEGILALSSEELMELLTV